jgi:hemerythrin
MPTNRISPSRPRAICAALRHGRKMLCRRIGEIVSGPDDMVGRGFATLVAAVEAAFRHEELIMETLGYVHLHEHREENAVVLSALHHVLPDVERGDHMLGRQVLSALVDVLDLHRLSGDLALTVAARPAEPRARGHAARATLHVATRRSTPR